MLDAKAVALAESIVSWWITEWLHPWLWVGVSAFLFVLTIVGNRPITTPRAEQASAITVVLVGLRQGLWIGFAVAMFALPLVVCVLACALYSPGAALGLMAQAWFESATHWWTLPAAAWLAAALGTITVRRYFVPWWSSVRRRLRLRQTGEELSDIRVEQERVQPKQFNPRDFFRDGFMFMGLDEHGQPIYIADAEWRSMHTKVVGPTQVGKGVKLGVILEQVIQKGWGCFMIDPKPDKHAKAIMREACKRTGRRFRELDLNGGAHKWAPFAGGTPRDRRSRLLAAFGLDDDGSQADFYKAGERALVDRLLPSWSGDLKALKNLISSQGLEESMKRTLSYINEWLAVPTFSPQKGRGFSIEKALREGDVVWVRANLTDKLIIKGATFFLMELVQEGLRLYGNGRPGHLTVIVDEVKTMVSETLANALATVAGGEMNMILTYQSILDLRSLPDKRLNARAIEDSINVNCKLTLCYMAANTETAEWASKMGGTIQKSVTRMESVSVGRWGVEEWAPERMISRQEVALIPENLVRTLPQRVGIFYRPNHLATLMYTAWVPVELLPEDESVLSMTAVAVDDGREPSEVSGPRPAVTKRKRKSGTASPMSDDGVIDGGQGEGVRGPELAKSDDIDVVLASEPPPNVGRLEDV